MHLSDLEHRRGDKVLARRCDHPCRRAEARGVEPSWMALMR